MFCPKNIDKSLQYRMVSPAINQNIVKVEKYNQSLTALINQKGAGLVCLIF